MDPGGVFDGIMRAKPTAEAISVRCSHGVRLPGGSSSEGSHRVFAEQRQRRVRCVFWRSLQLRHRILRAQVQVHNHGCDLQGQALQSQRCHRQNLAPVAQHRRGLSSGQRYLLLCRHRFRWFRRRELPREPPMWLWLRLQNAPLKRWRLRFLNLITLFCDSIGEPTDYWVAKCSRSISLFFMLFKLIISPTFYYRGIVCFPSNDFQHRGFRPLWCHLPQNPNKCYLYLAILYYCLAQIHHFIGYIALFYFIFSLFFYIL